MDIVRDYMNTDFGTIREDSRPEEALSQLEGHSAGIVENYNHQPVAAVTVEEIRSAISAYAPPLIASVLTCTPRIKVRSDVNMREVIQSPFIKTLVEEVKTALVVDHLNRPVGLLEADTVSRFMQSEIYSPATELPGEFINLSLTAYVLCKKCNYTNELTVQELNDLKEGTPNSAPNCKNPRSGIDKHRLALREPEVF